MLAVAPQSWPAIRTKNFYVLPRRVSAYPDENAAARRLPDFRQLVTNGAASRVFAARSPSAACARAGVESEAAELGET